MPDSKSVSSGQPDLWLLDRLALVRRACLAAVGLVAGVILLAWFFRPLGQILPVAWSEMKANSALGLLLCALNLWLADPRHDRRSHQWAKVCAAVSMLLAGSALLQHLSLGRTGLEVLLAADENAARPGLMSVQTALFILALGAAGFVIECNSVVGALLDLLTVLLVTLVLVVVAGYCFGASQLFGQMGTRVAPHTLFCMLVLSFVHATRRAQAGVFSVLYGIGIGSRIARQSLPVLLPMPFVLAGLSAYLSAMGWLSGAYAAALAATAVAVLLLMLVVAAARRINSLERDLRDMSLTDELTRIYNRRGFYLLGEHALREARRARKPLSVLFFDVDGLKRVNDTLGHESGSAVIADIADMLRETFRSCDVLGRLGGDEFAVVTSVDETGYRHPLLRLEMATTRLNGTAKHHYPVGYSVGAATAWPEDGQGFSALVEQADAQMYERKRAKRAAPERELDIEALGVGAL